MLQRCDIAAAIRQPPLSRRAIAERRDSTNLILQIRTLPFVARLIAYADSRSVRYAAIPSRRTRACTGFEKRIASSIEPNLSASTSRA